MIIYVHGKSEAMVLPHCWLKVQDVLERVFFVNCLQKMNIRVIFLLILAAHQKKLLIFFRMKHSILICSSQRYPLIIQRLSIKESPSLFLTRCNSFHMPDSL
jgi:hypothetical protein